MRKHEATDGWHSRGYLPHFDGAEITQFLTFRLSDSLPQQLLDNWRSVLKKEAVADFDTALRRRIELGSLTPEIANAGSADILAATLCSAPILRGRSRQDVCAPGLSCTMKSERQNPGAFGEVWRVFVAIELTASVRRKLIEHIDRLRSSMAEVRASWSRAENLHLTLKFVGETPVAQVEELTQAAERAARKIGPFEFVVEGCGAFPPRGQPRVLWIGIGDPTGQLRLLHRTLEEESANAGFPREQRPFHPHLTVARLRQPHGSRELAAHHIEIGFARETVSASELQVIKSELRSEGSEYTVISRHRLLDT